MRSNEFGTFGTISYNGKILCRTLEPTKCDGFKPNAVRQGLYKLAVTYSPKFGRPLPLLEQVPSRSGIRIHSGNTKLDTKGCILVGQHFNGTFLTESRVALDALIKTIKENFISHICISNLPESFLL